MHAEMCKFANIVGAASMLYHFLIYPIQGVRLSKLCLYSRIKLLTNVEINVKYIMGMNNITKDISGITTIGAGRAVTPPLFNGSKLEINNRMVNYRFQHHYNSSRVNVPY